MHTGKFYLLACLFAGLNSMAQEKPVVDLHNWKAPYHLAVPENWGTERFPLPISFAPQINYKGVEDIRFAPGWAKSASDNYWSYAFLWYLDDLVTIDARIIEQQLIAYYTGLFAANTDPSKIAGSTLKPVTANFKKTGPANGHQQAFSGSVEMNDYLKLTPLKLNVTVHSGYCVEDKKSILFFQLSPQSFSHSIWSELNAIWEGFRCRN